MASLIALQNVCAGFTGDDGARVPVLRGVSFSLQPGEVTALVGASGSGKSLTALAMLGLLQHSGVFAWEGNIFFGDEDLLASSEERLRHIRGRQISLVFQDPFASFNPMQRIATHLDLVLRQHTTLTASERLERAIALLHDVALDEPCSVLQKYPHQCSGGMLQRVMIAIALATRPKLLIADEITTALDVLTQQKIIRLLQRLQRDTGSTLLLITHHLALAASMAQRILVMAEGTIVEDAPVERLFAQPRHPYTRALLSSIISPVHVQSA